MPENKNNYQNQIDKLDTSIEKVMFDFNKKYKHDKEIEELSNRLNELNQKYRNITGSNIIEFLNSIEMNNSSASSKIPVETRVKNIQQLLQDSVGSLYFADEKQRFLRYEDYRLIDAYIPEISKCLDLYRDCILSPDDVTKKSLNYYYKDKTINEQENEIVSKNLKFLDKEYNISKEIKNQIREALLLGDLFTIILDINEETEKLLKEDTIFPSSKEIKEENYITESMIGFEDFTDFESLFETQDNSKKSEQDKVERINKAKKTIVDSINKNIKFYNNPLDLMSEKKRYENENNIKLNLKGSIVKIPNPENIIKIELDRHVIGYIYIEKNSMGFSDSGFTNRGINNLNRLMSYKKNDVFNSRYDFLSSDNTAEKTKFDLITDIFVRGVSRKINNKFINNNKDFKRLIYTLLKQDYILEKQVFITFLKPEQVHHFKLDSNDTYGISKLAKSLFLAKLYLATLITNLMQKVSRGRDKRAFYIDSSLDTDYESTVQSFIRDIKSKEITSNMLNSVSSVLNAVGAFEDYYIPTVDGKSNN